MSLFGGDDNADAPARPKSSLFEDDSAAKAKTGSSMFGDSTADIDEASPWGFTPKKNTRKGSLVKALLAGADVPDMYIDTFDGLQSGGSVSASDARQLLHGCGISDSSLNTIWDIVSSRGTATSLGRDEFNVLLALIGLAQEGEELSLDAVDERRRKLPVPSLPAPKPQQQQPPATPQTNTQSGAQASPEQRTTGMRKSSFGAGFGESDPWASPQLHKNHGHMNGVGSAAPQRTTSTFTTNAEDPSDSAGTYNGPPAGGNDNASSSWGGTTSYSAGHGEGFGSTPAAGGGFGGDDSSPTAPRRTAPTRSTSKGVEEVVTVSILEEKEGMFLFQHRNYEVASVRRSSKVIRRYSDFVWLLDCLHKRYSFRQLPLLPPKRVQINGNHIAADSTFLEKRRRGLARFANALVRHPVLREEQLVVMFLTVPTELAVWRKQATISVQEEFVGKSLPPTLEDSLPQNLQDTFDTVRSGVRRSADTHISLCNLAERLCKRKEGIAAEYGRFSLSLNAVTETSADAYAIDTNDVPSLNDGIKCTAKYVHQSQSLLDDEARAWDEGLLEDLKTMRDSLVSMRDMFDRRDKFARDNIPQLEKRIQANEQKLQGIKAKGEAAKPGEAEKVENAIVNDKQSIVNQHARGVFIKECVRDELLYFQNTQYRISRLHQDWAQERVKYAELQADNFRGLVDSLEGMPQGD
ncbi:Sorting nexin mvp1 [Vermiconidia calcicola]|uniref:Sorting nexin mvp1 n=1 Tax=Vermiconidia calcicola TaxID=1690605 RepID=A0ACC3MV22_9PEZI|nr:Sorting nexin mvp1 [Vermiconidia calcicola]